MGFIRRSNVRRIPRLMPADRIETVTLYPRIADTATEAGYGPGVEYTARRKPTSLEVVAMLGGVGTVEWCDFQLYQVDGQTLPPRQHYKLVDAGGHSWDISWVRDVNFSRAWTCHCARMPDALPVANAFQLLSGNFLQLLGGGYFQLIGE